MYDYVYYKIYANVLIFYQFDCMGFAIFMYIHIIIIMYIPILSEYVRACHRLVTA